jgi:hypothetical protein
LRELVSGAELKPHLEGHRGRVTVLAFSPDGRVLASGSSDSTIMLWDWPAVVGLRPAPDADASKLEAAWEQLADDDPSKAYAAIGTLSAGGDKGLDVLNARLQPVSEKSWGPVRRLVADLESSEFAVREKAVEELARFGADVVLQLHAVLAGGPTLETTRRIEALLARPEIGRWSREAIRQVRAVQTLEQISSPEARKLLQSLATGIPEARLTQEARSALQRLPGR